MAPGKEIHRGEMIFILFGNLVRLRKNLPKRFK